MMSVATANEMDEDGSRSVVCLRVNAYSSTRDKFALRMHVPRHQDAPPPADLLLLSPRVWCALIFLAVFLAHGPALSGEFLWDDQPGHVTRPELQSIDGLRRIWFEPGATQQYYPLLHSAFWLQHQLWGDAPPGYHLVNVLLHGLAACLLARLLRQLAIPGAGLAALLFALHPVTVESVAWISEQKNTLSAVWFLLAASAYLRFHTTRRPANYAWATFLFVLALATKTVTATLPAALLVLLWWRQRTLSLRRDVAPLTPWLALSAVAGLVTVHVERTLIGAQGGDFALNAIERGLLAGRIVWFYLGKLFWPANLSFVYPKWIVTINDAVAYVAPVAVLALLAIFWRVRVRRPALLASALLFGGLLFPALGFVNVFPFLYSYVADHFQYLACTAVLALVAAGWTTAPIATVAVKRTAAALVLTGLAAMTWQQSQDYRNVFTLYRATLARNPDAWMAHNNLGIALVEAGRPAEALSHYEAALRARPNYAEGENNFAFALIALNRPAEAVPHLRRALALQPRYADAHNNLGRALMATGDTGAGRAAFAAAVESNPRFALAHVNLGLALANSGDATSAAKHFEAATGIDPSYAEAWLHWGAALTVLGKPADALPKFDVALRLRPAFVPGLVARSRTLSVLGRYDDAVAVLRQAIEIAPHDGQAHLLLALLLRQSGRGDEANRHFAEARRLGADFR